jgi:hypothetical protein
MPKCPKCKKEIDHLYNISDKWERYIMTIDKQGYTDYELSKDWQGDNNSFDCPECEEALFANEVDAIKFLKGGKGGKMASNNNKGK